MAPSSLSNCLYGSQTTWHLQCLVVAPDTQAALWRHSGEEELRLPANASTRAALGRAPSRSQAFGCCSPRQRPACSLMRHRINHSLCFLYSDALTFGAVRECPSQGSLIPRDGKHLPESTTFGHDPADSEPAPPTASFIGLSHTGPLSLP